VKEVSDIFAPVRGRVLEINQTVVDEPGLVNKDPYGAGWLVRLELSKPAELDALMDSEKYDKFVVQLSEEESE
jgi:glycine cleavage system H protein